VVLLCQSAEPDTEEERSHYHQKEKLQYLSHHIMTGQKYTLLQLIVQGMIRGKRGTGRRRLFWLKNLRDWFNCTNMQLLLSSAEVPIQAKLT